MSALLKHESERTEAECQRYAEAEKLRQEAIDAEVKRLLTPDGIHELMQDYELWADERFQRILAGLCREHGARLAVYLRDDITALATSKAKVPPLEYYLGQLGPKWLEGIRVGAPDRRTINRRHVSPAVTEYAEIVAPLLARIAELEAEIETLKQEGA